MAKRLTICAAVAALCLLGAVAAPAHPLHAADFELAPAAPAVHAAGGGYVSRPLRAPRRFDLLGMRWRGNAEPAISARPGRARRAGVRVGRKATPAPPRPAAPPAAL